MGRRRFGPAGKHLRSHHLRHNMVYEEAGVGPAITGLLLHSQTNSSDTVCPSNQEWTHLKSISL